MGRTLDCEVKIVFMRDPFNLGIVLSNQEVSGNKLPKCQILILLCAKHEVLMLLASVNERF